MSPGERVVAVVSAGSQTGVLIWGATATDGVLAVLLGVFGGLAAVGTLVNIAK